MQLFHFIQSAISHTVTAGKTLPSAQGWVAASQITLVTGAALLPLGFGSGFIKFQRVRSFRSVLAGVLICAVTPGLSEEVAKPYPCGYASLSSSMQRLSATRVQLCSFLQACALSAVTVKVDSTHVDAASSCREKLTRVVASLPRGRAGQILALI